MELLTHEMPEGLRAVGSTDADGSVEDDGLTGMQPAQDGEVGNLRGGQFGLATKSTSARVVA